MNLYNQEGLPVHLGRTIRYYGGKAKLNGFITESLTSVGMRPGMSILDAFSGTSIVSQAFKSYGLQTTANDHLYFCYALADAHLSLNSEPKFLKLPQGPNTLSQLNRLPGKIDFITRNYSPYGKCQRMYLSIDNAKKVDAIRIQIESWKNSNLLTVTEFNYLVATLIYAINLVSNVTGTYGAYLKFWENRSTKPLTLEPIRIFNNHHKNRALNLDALEVVKRPFDLMYFDPPYNSRGYFSNYFLLELIAKGWFENTPILSGITGQPKSLEVKSDFSSKKEVIGAFQRLIGRANAPMIALSYNNEGLLPHDRLVSILSDFGKIKTFTRDHKRYRSINQDGTNANTREVLITVRKK